MIRRAIVTSTAVLFMALALPLTANAQSVYVLAGASLPTGDYGDFADTGWLGAVGVTFPVAEAGLWAGAEALYGQNGASAFDGESFKVFSAMGLLGYSIPTESNIAPYVWGGAGIMSLSNGDSESGFGWQLGAGASLQGEGNVSPFAEARYQSASLDGGTLSFIGLEIGVSVGLGD